MGFQSDSQGGLRDAQKNMLAKSCATPHRSDMAIETTYQIPAAPAPYRGVGSELIRWICKTYLSLTGWRVTSGFPDVAKAVLIAAPHTSNWDGINMLAAAGYYRVKLRWMGKASLVKGPFGGLVRRMGCVPVDRANAADLVEQTTAAFKAADDLILAIAPEGTRSKVATWKTGYHRIALAAGVPLMVSVLDYGSKTIRIADVFGPSTDYDADFNRIVAHYEDAVGKRGEKFSVGAARGDAQATPSSASAGSAAQSD